MRLSEAIRLGAMLHPQGFGSMRDYVDETEALPRVSATCALGAAAMAGYLVFEHRHHHDPQYVTCPACPSLPQMTDRLCWVITHLNDYHRWTRERIADWVATVEPTETPDPHASTSDVRGTEVRG